VYGDAEVQISCLIRNSAKFLISSAYPKHKNPTSTKEMGLYNSTMAISTGFTVGLNVDN
jgi:uncharacterized oligopeptide transporter (OPT) family protein